MTPRPGSALLAAVLLMSLGVACGDGDEPGPAAGASSSAAAEPSDSPAEPPAETESALPEAVPVDDARGETIHAEPFADFMVAAADLAWVSGVAPGLVAYDTAGEIVHQVDFDSQVVQAMATDGQSVYAAGVHPDALLVVDAKTGKETARVPLDATPLEESSVAARAGTAWVLVDIAAPKLVVVEGGKVTGTLAAPQGALAARFGFDSLWVTAAGGQVARLDPADGRVLATYAVGVGARFLTVGDDAVWTLDASDGAVSRVDPQTGAVAQVLVSERPINGGDIAADQGAVWAQTAYGVTRVDPATVTATHLIKITPGSGSVAATADWLWISDHDHLAVHRVPLDYFNSS